MLCSLDRYLATTHFEPTDARNAFPCFDEPDLKARFSIVIVREKRHVALANMPLNHTDGVRMIDYCFLSITFCNYQGQAKGLVSKETVMSCGVEVKQKFGIKGVDEGKVIYPRRRC